MSRRAPGGYGRRSRGGDPAGPGSRMPAAGPALDHGRNAMGIRRVIESGGLRAAACALRLGVGVCEPAVAAPDALAVQFQCNFVTSPNDCGFFEQSLVLPRASVVSGVSRDGTTSVRLHTEPGDHNVAGSGSAERDDLSLSQAATGCYAGQEQWWAHSILFPDDHVRPPAPTPGNWTWGVVFDFHNTTNGGGQANFQINAMPDGLSFQGYAGDPANPVSYTAAIGPTVKNVWYDFVYHVKWSSGSDGYFYASVNGVQKLAYTGPTLYVNQRCYLKLANYPTPFR